jgi:hypothetical protein
MLLILMAACSFQGIKYQGLYLLDTREEASTLVFALKQPSSRIILDERKGRNLAK